MRPRAAGRTQARVACRKDGTYVGWLVIGATGGEKLDLLDNWKNHINRNPFDSLSTTHQRGTDAEEGLSCLHRN